MKILFVTGLFAEDNKKRAISGMPGYVYKISKYLNDCGNKAIVVAPGAANRIWHYWGVEVHSVKMPYFTDKKNSFSIFYKVLIRDFLLQRAIQKIHRLEDIDIIQYTGWYGIGILHNKKIPSVLRISSYTKIQLASIKTPKEIKIYSFLERLAARNKDGIFAPSYAVGKAFEKDIKRNVQIIETPFFDELNGQYNEKSYEHKLKNKTYLLYFGRLSADKGICVIGEVLQKVLAYENIYFVFAGRNESLGKTNAFNYLLQKAAPYQDRVILLGNISHESLFPIIKYAKAVIMPSLMDNFPNACAEAMYFGKPVIGTDGSSLEQFITDGKNGFLAKPGSPDSLLKKIHMLFECSEMQLQQMGKNAQDRICNLSPDILVPKLLKYYQHVLRNRDSKINYIKRRKSGGDI